MPSKKRFYVFLDALIEVDGPNNHRIALKFRDVAGNNRRTTLPANEKRNPRVVLAALDNCGANLPLDRSEALECVNQALQTSVRHLKATERSGWHGEEFVMPNLTYSRKKPSVVRHLNYFDGIVGEGPRGTLDGWAKATKDTLLTSSTALAVVGVAFAGSLLWFYPTLTGLAFNLAGQSGSGKTTLLKLAQSIWSSPDNDELPKLNVTLTQVERQCSLACDRFVAFDEFGASDLTGGTRKQLVDAFAFMVNGGAGKSRSALGQRAVGHGNLTFRVSAITTSEEPLSEMDGKSRVEGAQLRFINISIKPRDEGGTLDSANGDLKRMLTSLMKSLSAHHAVAGPAFVKALVQLDGAEELIKGYVSDFVRTLHAEQSSQLQSRYLESFGLVYAALRLARKFGLIEVPKQRIRESVIDFFEASELHRRGQAAVTDLLKDLCDWLDNEELTPIQKNADTSTLAFTRRHSAREQACIDVGTLVDKYGSVDAKTIEYELLRHDIQIRDARGKARQQVEFKRDGERVRERRMVIDLVKLRHYLSR